MRSLPLKGGGLGWGSKMIPTRIASQSDLPFQGEVEHAARLASAPDIPTVDEAGAPGVYISTWFGLWAPKGTPAEAVGKLSAAALEALADPAVAKRLTDLGQEIPPPEQQTPAALSALLKGEMEKWGPIIKGAGIKAD